MAGLTGKTIASAYRSLLRMNDDTNGIDTSAEVVTDGGGTKSALNLSDDVVGVQPQNDDTTTTFIVKAKGGGSLLSVDSTNSVVKVNAGQDIANTMYANFGTTQVETTNFAVNTHYALPFGNGIFANNTLANLPNFGTGTDPATTFTTADANSDRACVLVPCLWYIPDNISIDSVTSLEGADTATGDTTRMHLFSYTFNTGSTSALTSGTLLAYNSDVTNAGSEQAYKSSWTVDSEDVNGGSVVLAFFRSDSINSDYSTNIVIKYHLR